MKCSGTQLSRREFVGALAWGLLLSVLCMGRTLLRLAATFWARTTAYGSGSSEQATVVRKI